MRTARDRAGLTQEQLAERLRVTLRTVGNWERTSVPANRVHRVRDVLGDYLTQDHPDTAPLRSASDVELLAEIAWRFARQQRKEGERDERPAATKTPDSGPGSIIEIAGQAARKTGRPTRAQERRGHTQNRGEKDDASPS